MGWAAIIPVVMSVLGSAFGDKGGGDATRRPDDPFPQLTASELKNLMEIFQNPRRSSEYLEFQRGMGESLTGARSDARAAHQRSGVSHRSGRFLRAEAHNDSKVMSEAAQMSSAYLTKLMGDAPGRAQQLRSVFMNAQPVQQLPTTDFWARLASGIDTGSSMASLIEQMRGLAPERPPGTSATGDAQEGAFGNPDSIDYQPNTFWDYPTGTEGGGRR